MSWLFAVLATFAIVAGACGSDAADEAVEAAGEATDELSMPGEGVSVTAARANWSTGYFQAAIYASLLEELGYEVSDPAASEFPPSNGYTAMA
ncbi:MAG: hypothetical protein ACRBK7_14335, partial [Acidimicrobiales bacterium]